MKTMALIRLSVLVIWLSGIVMAQDDTAIDSRGRKIVLKPDKTWEYASAQPSPLYPIHGKPIVGHDLARLARLVEAKGLKKSEFETEKEYRDRVKAWAQLTTNPQTGLPLSNTVLVLDGVTTYDAETQRMSVSGYEVARRTNYLVAYSNRYVLSAELRLVEWTNHDWAEKPFAHKLSFTMSPGQAKSVKPDLSLAIYGTPVTATTEGVPKLLLVPAKYVLFDRTSGDVYLIVDEKDVF